MSEICLDCWNKTNGTNESERKYFLSEELDLCEECGEWKHVIIVERKAYYMHKFKYIVLPIKIIYNVIYILCRLMILPYLLFKHNREKNKRNK